MEALGRTEIKGHTIDVSWAVVQRSQGFLDGGDRTMILSNSSSSGSSGFDSDSWDVSPPSSAGLVTPPLGSQTPPPPPSSCSTTLLVTNLPSVLFSQPADLQPLLCPFGEIKNLQIVNNGPGAEQGNISVVVEYKTLTQAMEARDSLSGQVYTNQPVQADFMVPKTAPSAEVDAYAWPSAKAEPKIGLNPYAPPFLAQNAPSQDVPMMPFASHYANPVVKISEESVSPMSPAGSPSDLCLPASYSPAPWNLGLRAPQGDLLRPRSAPSRPGNGIHDARPGWWTCSTSQALPDLSSASLRSPFIA
ncbi:hypothetical protein EIP86_001443 [Pleurotus ostreatoroseus]|nr:hypothetical protein EIP86_001443 [Pleurotus ostreatoroseus]